MHCYCFKQIYMFLCNNLKVLIKMYLLGFEKSIKSKTIEVFWIRILDKRLPFSKNGFIKLFILNINRTNSMFLN